jgi:hypothetical protein
MKLMSMRIAATCTILLVTGIAYAGNVVKIVKDGSPPKYQETKYNAILNDYNYNASIVGEGFAEPVGGNIGEFAIENVKLKLKENKFKSGGVFTEELGNVRILFSSSLSGTGFIALLTDEQLKKLDQFLAKRKTAAKKDDVSLSGEYKPVHFSELVVAFKNHEIKGSADSQGNITPHGGKVGEVHMSLGSTSGSTPSSKIVELLSDSFEQGYFSTKSFGTIKVMFRKSDGAYVVFMTDKQRAQIKHFLSE